MVKGGMLKTANSHIKRLALDSDLKRLYAATKEGLLLVLNVSMSSSEPGLEPAIFIVHTM